MTDTTTGKGFCEIVPCDVHNSDGITTEWLVRDPRADKTRADGFNSAEAAVDWAARNGYAPDTRLVAAEQLQRLLRTMGPYEAAGVIVGHFVVRQLVSFEVAFRQAMDDKITAEDHALALAAGMF